MAVEGGGAAAASSWQAAWWHRAARQAAALLMSLEVDEQAMQDHVRADATWASQQILVGLSGHLGKHRAQELLQAVLERQPGAESIVDEVAAAAGIDRDEVRQWAVAPDVREAMAMVDDVANRLGRDRS